MPAVAWEEILTSAVPHALRIVVLLLASYVLWRVLRRAVPRIIAFLLRRDMQNRDQDEVKQRIETLEGAFRQGTGVILVLGVAFAVLAELEFNISPFLAGLGIAGIAFGFAAQYFVRDLLNGLIMLVEDWYSKGDVVRVAGIGGLVEDITLRRTVLRDLDGIVHSIPNGEISIASNFTKDWSRVNINVSVAYGENLDRVINVINQVGRELADDPYWGTLVLEPPSVLRVDSLADSGVELKILGNTRPIKQWDVMGELRRRLKNRFDEEGIEIPWPHTKVYFGNPLEQAAQVAPRAPKGGVGVEFTMEAPPAMARKDTILSVIKSGRWALVTDLDGTISNIVARPQDARVSEKIKALLGQLREGGAVVSIVSGRPVQQVREMVGVEGLVYIGNHGFEYLEDGVVRLQGATEAQLATISRALDEVHSVTRIPGVSIERKGVTATIHYRMSADPEDARHQVLAVIARSQAAAALKVTEGRRVLELRPPVAVNKGTALRFLVEREHLNGLLYLGDDITDLDAFYTAKMLQKEGVVAIGIGVLSGENRPEFRLALDLTLESVEQVEQLMEWIATILTGPRSAADLSAG